MLDVDWWIEEFKVKTAHTGRGPHERNSTVSYQLPGHQVSITRNRLLGLQGCFFLFLLIPSIAFALSLLLAPSLLIDVTQTWGHIAGPPPPSPLRYAPSFFLRQDFSTFFPRSLESNCAYPHCEAFSAVGVARRLSIFFPRRLVSNCVYPRYEAFSAVGAVRK